MKTRVFTVCLLFGIFHFNIGFCQSFVQEDFIDFSHPNNWFGNVDLFSNPSPGILQLSDTISNDAQIFKIHSNWDNAVWRFRVNMDFMPSSSNYAAFAVGMDQTDLFGDNRGYFIRIGGGTQRRISLMRRNGMSNSTLLESPQQFLQMSSVDVLVELERSDAGLWTLRVDTGSGWIHLGSIIENSLEPGLYIGWVCRYTTTRADKISLSEVAFSGECRFSNVNFAVTRVEVPQDDLAILHINVPPRFSSIFDDLQFQPGFNNASVYYSREHPFEIVLQVEPGVFLENAPVIRNVVGLMSFDTLQRIDSSLVFFNYSPSVGDIVINELMVDPSPSVASLPEVEYVELLNNTQWSVDLSSWQIQTGTTVRVIPYGVLRPNEYILLVRSDDAWVYSDSLQVVPMEWGVNALPNSAGNVVLFSTQGRLIDQVAYSSSWYNDNTKSSGGWSLERRRSDILCNDPVNWSASNSSYGGTPGRENTLDANSKQLMLVRKGLVAKRFGELEFNLAISSLDTISFYVADEKVEFTHFAPNVLRLDFDKWLVEGQNLELRVLGSLHDCMGGKWGDTLIHFAIPAELIPGDLVINEIVPAPFEGGASYVEIFNKSAKWLDVNAVQLARYDGQSFDARRVIDSSFLLEPYAYLVFTPQPERIIRDYPMCNFHRLQARTLPSLPNESGGIALLNAQGVLLDSMIYSSSFHSPFIQNTRGVALERVSAQAPSLLSSNWSSASSDVGWGTPGLPNSHASILSETEHSFRLSPEVVNLNSFQLLEAHFQLSSSGARGVFRISDVSGVELYSETQVLAQSGFFTWDGRNARGGYATAGLYVATLEVIFADGSRKVYKDAFAVVH
jgi:hypothetical protein